MANTNILTAIHSLKYAKEHLEDFVRQAGPMSNGGKIFVGYVKRIGWMLNDFKTHPAFSDFMREGLRDEVASDVFALPAIHENIQKLPPLHRDCVEKLIDILLKADEGTQIDIRVKEPLETI